MHTNFKRCDWGDYNSFSSKIKGILQIRMNVCKTTLERDIMVKICKSLKDGNDYGYKRDQSGRGNRSHGSYRPGGSSYDYRHKDRSYGGSWSGGSSHGSGSQDKSGGSQAKRFECELDSYAILGLTKAATQSDIKKQFRKLALEHHPGTFTVNSIVMLSYLNILFFVADKNMHLSADEVLKKQELMKRINSAYAKLSA